MSDESTGEMHSVEEECPSCHFSFVPLDFEMVKIEGNDYIATVCPECGALNVIEKDEIVAGAPVDPKEEAMKKWLAFMRVI